MEESINQILSNIESLKNTNLIRKEDVILFVCELFYVVYLSKENHCESILNWSGNLLELVEKLIATIYNNTENSANGKLLSDIQEDLSKFKYVDLDCSKLINSLRNVDNKTIKELVKNGLFERLCSRYGMNGDFSSPNSVTLLAKELLNIDSSESILDMCSGVGNFLVEVASNCGVQILEGIDNNYQLSLISRIRLSIFTGRENIIDVGDALTYEYKNKYNKIFCNYPFGFKIDNYKLGEIKSKNNLFYNWRIHAGESFDWLFVNNVVSLLKNGGKAIIIMPDGPLFKVADKGMKMDLLISGMIEAIVKLPQNLFSTTSLSMNLVVLSKKSNNKLKFIDASKEFVKEKFKNVLLVDNVKALVNGKDNEKVKSIKYVDILNNDAILKVDNYVGRREVAYHNPCKLSYFLNDIFRGYQMTMSEQKELEDENGNYEILTISDIDNGKISNCLKKIKTNNKLDRYLVKNGDVIISSKGTRVKIAVAEINDRKIIANGNLIVLRINQDKLNPYFLAMYLNSSDGQEILKQIQTGSIIISINPGKLSAITISTMPFEEQVKLAKRYKLKQEQMVLAKENIKKLEDEYDNFYDNEVKAMFDK